MSLRGNSCLRSCFHGLWLARAQIRPVFISHRGATECLAKEEVKANLAGSHGIVQGLVFSPDGKKLPLGGGDEQHAKRSCSVCVRPAVGACQKCLRPFCRRHGYLLCMACHNSMRAGWAAGGVLLLILAGFFLFLPLIKAAWANFFRSPPGGFSIELALAGAFAFLAVMLFVQAADPFPPADA
jgi:hypothetical protein